MKHTAWILGVCGLFFLTGRGWGQEKEFISYKLDGRSWFLTEVKLQHHPENYLDIEGLSRERVDFGENAFPRYREAEAGISFQIMPGEGGFVATHQARSSDELPVYASWYEVVKRDGRVEIVNFLADMDKGDTDVQIFTVTIENFGEEGTLVRGTFSGRLIDESGGAHEIIEGRFALRRQDVS